MMIRELPVIRELMILIKSSILIFKSMGNVKLIALCITATILLLFLITRQPLATSHKTGLLTSRFSAPIKLFWYEDESKDEGIFNPTLLPYEGRFIAVARMKQRKFGDPEIPLAFYENSLIACTMELKSIRGGGVYMKCIKEPVILNVPYTKEFYREKAARYFKTGGKAFFSCFLGPEDPRLLWDEKGAPLMFYGSNSHVDSRHRTVFVTDLRTVIFDDIKEDMPPIQFKFAELGRNLGDEYVSDVEKNWAPLIVPGGSGRKGGLYVQSTLKNRKLFSTSSTEDNKALLTPLEVTDNLTRACMDQLLRRDSRAAVHQASNFITVKQCHETSCFGGTGRVFYLQLFHIKHYNGAVYERFVATWNEEFELRSISGPIFLSGVGDSETAFVTSMNFIENKQFGYLDSYLVVSFGLRDSLSRALFTTPEELLQGESLCLLQ